MNPPYYPAESVPLQVGNFDVPPVQPGAPPEVPYTTVTVPPEPPKDHIIWSLCCFCYFNPCCLGLAALIFSIKARDRKTLGDMQGAQTYGTTAKQLNIAATVLVCISFLITIIVLAVVFSTIRSYTSSYGQGYGYRYPN